MQFLYRKKDMQKYSEERYSGASARSTEEKIREIEQEIDNMTRFQMQVKEMQG